MRCVPVLYTGKGRGRQVGVGAVEVDGWVCPPVWRAIRHYVDLARRNPTREDPVFTVTTDAGKYLRDYYGTPQPEGSEPLTGEAVSQALKRYAAAAGMDPDAATVHSLRHLGAELYH